MQTLENFKKDLAKLTEIAFVTHPEKDSEKYTANAIDKWNNAMLEDALVLIDKLEEIPNDKKELEKLLLNGADSWHAYSWGGMGLITNIALCEHYLTPYDIAQAEEKFGYQKHPVNYRYMLDIQASAFAKASRKIGIAFTQYKKLNKKKQ